MNKIFYVTLALVLLSCGDDEKDAAKELNNVLSELVEKNKIKKELKNEILQNYRDAQSKSNEEDSEEEEDNSKIKKVNSFEIFNNIHKDRSIYMHQYATGGKIIITDLLLKNVYISDDGSGFVKCATALPVDSKKMNTVGVKSQETSREFYNEYTMEFETFYETIPSSQFYYKKKKLSSKSELAKSDFPVIIEFKNPEELKKIGLLDWEYNPGNELDKLVSIKGVIHQDNVEYRGGNGEEKDIKSYDIHVKITDAEIYKK